MKTGNTEKSRGGGREKSVLVVEDERDLAELISFNLEREGYAARRAHTGDDAVTEARRQPPDLIILDRMLPGRSGDEVISELRKDAQTARVPVMMLTAKSDESDQLVGFALGADDYLTKPFSMKVLIARVHAILRRGEPSETDVLSAGPFILDRDRFEARIDGDGVSLTATEFRLLRVLMAARGRVLDRSQIIDKVLGSGAVVTDRTIDVHITALRKKVGQSKGGAEAAGWIQTVRGVGYAFRQPAG